MATKTEWMIDVLDDLICFCLQNEIKGAPVEQLDNAKQILADELQYVRLKEKLRGVSENQPLI